MPIDQSTVLGTSMGVLLFTTVFTIGYSIYMAVLNHRQAKVKEVLERTNRLLEAQNQILWKMKQEAELLNEYTKEALKK